jgi:methylaspartate ammonia-lyase
MTSRKSQRVVEVITYRGLGGYYFEDLEHVRAHRTPVSERYHTATTHQRFPYVRTPAPVIGVGLKIEDGRIFFGDSVAVSFSGKSGRAIAGSQEDLESWFKNDFSSWIKTQEISSWIDLERNFINKFPATPAFVRYAVSQALVGASSAIHNQPPAVLMARELGRPLAKSPIPSHGSSGADFGATVDRMLARRIPFLPQGQFEDLDAQIGSNGKQLVVWIREFVNRAKRFNYQPTLTLDFHGALGVLCENDSRKVAQLIATLCDAAKPLNLHVESPIVGLDLADHATKLARLRQDLAMLGTKVAIIADEWANENSDIAHLITSRSVDGIHIKCPDTGTLSECAVAIDACRSQGIFVILGGSCTETDISARLSAHLAMATQPDALLIKPGMGFDEAYAMLTNEMARILAQAT